MEPSSIQNDQNNPSLLQNSGQSPTVPKNTQASDTAAIELLRQKINRLYEEEPDAKEELREAKSLPKAQSKHQQFMLDLSNSGKSLAEIQAAWHEYYINLPDHEKHEVWQEFYANHGQTYTYTSPTLKKPPSYSKSAARSSGPRSFRPQAPSPIKDSRTANDIRSQLVNKVYERSRPKQVSHWRSMLFGLSMGCVVLVIMLFSFFNERFIAPFITPSKVVSSTPIIIDPSSTSVGPEPKIIIPKINVEIPVVYSTPNIEEQVIQKALEEGVVHYPITAKPGELGNGAIFGHSSNNILNRGKYKFAFVLLRELEPGDTFFIHKDGKRYVYRVYEKKVVSPTDISVLGPTGKPATMTLITCDPPGTSINRLVVIGEQISPDPGGNIASNTSNQEKSKPAKLPSDSPSLWRRLTGWITS